MKTEISPSMMCADITRLEETLGVFEKYGINYLHVDIMDGSFVPNFALGTDYCKALRGVTSIPLDIHLMTEKPEEKLGWFDFGAGDMVSVHAESTAHLQKALSEIKNRGAMAFAALSPATPLCALDYVASELDGVLVMAVNPGFAGQKMVLSTLDKIKDVRNYLDSKGNTGALIEVDGNVSFENSVKMKAAGADILVAGTSSIFSREFSVEDGILKLKEVLGE